jgi:hypothetical protein
MVQPTKKLTLASEGVNKGRMSTFEEGNEQRLGSVSKTVLHGRHLPLVTRGFLRTWTVECKITHSP